MNYSNDSNQSKYSMMYDVMLPFINCNSCITELEISEKKGIFVRISNWKKSNRREIIF